MSSGDKIHNLDGNSDKKSVQINEDKGKDEDRQTDILRADDNAVLNSNTPIIIEEKSGKKEIDKNDNENEKLEVTEKEVNRSRSTGRERGRDEGKKEKKEKEKEKGSNRKKNKFGGRNNSEQPNNQNNKMTESSTRSGRSRSVGSINKNEIKNEKDEDKDKGNDVSPIRFFEFQIICILFS